jgi:hypothetical protein
MLQAAVTGVYPEPVREDTSRPYDACPPDGESSVLPLQFNRLHEIRAAKSCLRIGLARDLRFR